MFGRAIGNCFGGSGIITGSGLMTGGGTYGGIIGVVIVFGVPAPLL